MHLNAKGMPKTLHEIPEADRLILRLLLDVRLFQEPQFEQLLIHERLRLTLPVTRQLPRHRTCYSRPYHPQNSVVHLLLTAAETPTHRYRPRDVRRIIGVFRPDIEQQQVS